MLKSVQMLKLFFYKGDLYLVVLLLDIVRKCVLDF